jgi:hypothetical protein
VPRPVEPKPLGQYQCKTVVLRVPTQVWPLVSTGRVNEFRSSPGNVPQLWDVPMPTFAVAYRRRPSSSDYDYRVLFLATMRREALGAITEAGLIAAGYDGEQAFAHFRRDWTLHEKKRFEPLRTVFVYTVRPIQTGDHEIVGHALTEHLYGQHLAQAQLQPRTVQIQRRAPQVSRRRATVTGRR